MTIIGALGEAVQTPRCDTQWKLEQKKLDRSRLRTTHRMYKFFFLNHFDFKSFCFLGEAKSREFVSDLANSFACASFRKKLGINHVMSDEYPGI